MVLSFVSCDFINEFINELIHEQDPVEDEKVENEKTENEKIDPPLNGNHSSCDLVPEGYTGGITSDGCFHHVTGLYWLETYEEVLEAVELLKAHGSKIRPIATFNCDGEPYDLKWVFEYSRSKADKLEEGKNFFDRKIDNGKFYCYIFRKDVTIDVLNYSKVSMYDANRVISSLKSDDDIIIEDTSLLSFDWYGKKESGYIQPPGYSPYNIYYADQKICKIEYNEEETALTEEYMQILLNSLVIIP